MQHNRQRKGIREDPFMQEAIVPITRGRWCSCPHRGSDHPQRRHGRHTIKIMQNEYITASVSETDTENDLIVQADILAKSQIICSLGATSKARADQFSSNLDGFALLTCKNSSSVLAWPTASSSSETGGNWSPPDCYSEGFERSYRTPRSRERNLTTDDSILCKAIMELLNQTKRKDFDNKHVSKIWKSLSTESWWTYLE